MLPEVNKALTVFKFEVTFSEGEIMFILLQYYWPLIGICEILTDK